MQYPGSTSSSYPRAAWLARLPKNTVFASIPSTMNTGFSIIWRHSGNTAPIPSAQFIRNCVRKFPFAIEYAQTDVLNLPTDPTYLALRRWPSLKRRRLNLLFATDRFGLLSQDTTTKRSEVTAKTMNSFMLPIFTISKSSLQKDNVNTTTSLCVTLLGVLLIRSYPPFFLRLLLWLPGRSRAAHYIRFLSCCWEKLDCHF